MYVGLSLSHCVVSILNHPDMLEKTSIIYTGTKIEDEKQLVSLYNKYLISYWGGKENSWEILLHLWNFEKINQPRLNNYIFVPSRQNCWVLEKEFVFSEYFIFDHWSLCPDISLTQLDLKETDLLSLTTAGFLNVRNVVLGSARSSISFKESYKDKKFVERVLQTIEKVYPQVRL